MNRALPPIAALLLICCVAAQADEPSPQQKLEEVERGVASGKQDGEVLAKQAVALKAEVARLQAQAVQAASGLQDIERQITAEENALAELQRNEADQKARLEQGRGREVSLLAALERLAAVPPTAIAFAPGSPVDLARGGMLMSAIIPRLQAQAQEIGEALAQLARMRSQIEQQRAALAARHQAQEAARQNIAELIRKRQALEGETEAKARAAQQRVATLVAEAADLRQAIEKIERDREEKLREEAKRAAAQTASVAVPPPSGPGPRLVEPVAGEIVERFGAAEDYGTSKGLSFGTRPGAAVVAPCAGEIMFAGPFRGYGQILIIDHGGGYHLLMAGIGRIQGAVGQKVVAGEPVGAMAVDGSPKLYLELRRDGQPVDPLPWLSVRDGKASG